MSCDFTEFDGKQTIGFLKKNIIIENVGSNNVLTGDFMGGIGLSRGYEIKEKDSDGNETGGVAFIPYADSYAGRSYVLLCAAKEKYGRIGDVIEVYFKYQADNITAHQGNACICCIIAQHLDKIPENNSTYGGKGFLTEAESGREIEISLVVDNQYRRGDTSWLGPMRSRFYYYKNAYISFRDAEREEKTYQYRTSYITQIKNLGELQSGSEFVNAEQVSSSPTTDWLLTPSEDERRFGLNIFEANQQLIRFSTSAGIAGSTGGDALTALKNYSKFMYFLLNSQMQTANYNLVSMPWLRPGFNVWVDPLYSDTVYYLSEVQHQGNPMSGATTSVSLIFGRPRGTFAANSGAFGSMKDTNDNVFINTMNSDQRISGSNGTGPWGDYLESAADFKAVKKATEEYYGHEITQTTHASVDSFHKSMYVDGVKSSPLNGSIDSAKIFNGEYTADEIKAKIEQIYANAPDVVKERSQKLKTAVEGARKYIKLHYDKERTDI